jgi:hypothetical protein
MQDTGDASLPTEVSQESSQVKKAKADELDRFGHFLPYLLPPFLVYITCHFEFSRHINFIMFVMFLDILYIY